MRSLRFKGVGIGAYSAGLGEVKGVVKGVVATAQGWPSRVQKSLEQMFGRLRVNNSAELLGPTRAVPHFRPRILGPSVVVRTFWTN